MVASFWVILLAVLAYGLVHSLLASLQAKARARHWFGPVADRWFRLVYNFVAAVTLLPVLVLPVFLPDRDIYRIHFPWILLSLAGQVLALVALVVGLAQTGLASFLGLRQLLGRAVVPQPRLVVNGLYRWVRHPLYTAGLVFVWLVPAMTWNLLALNLGLSLYIIIGAWYEERKLMLEFGEAYTEYRRRTPMLIPLPSLLRRR